MSIVVAKNLVKEYHLGETVTKAVNGIDLLVEEGEFLAITGKSGSGKSTLLYQLSLLDTPTSGEVFIAGESSKNLINGERTAMRLSMFGYVFQEYALVPELTALENVSVPLLMQGCRGNGCIDRAKDVLTQVGLGERLGNRPSQLSGGEQQRVSIARALVNKPRILFADEPTANLDSVTSHTIMDILTKLHDEGLTIIMITHEREYAQLAKRQIELEDGKIIS